MRHRTRETGSLACALLAITILFWAPGSALADNVITSCDDYCALTCPTPAGNCKLAETVGPDAVCVLDTGGVVCGATEGPIELDDGTDLDLNGEVLECATGVSCNDGVTMNASGSRVFSSVDGVEAVITGSFDNAVNCNSHSASVVTGIAVEHAYVGMRNCQTVTKNVIRDAQRFFWGVNFGILTKGVSVLNDRIEDNYIEDRSYAVRLLAPGPGNPAPRIVIENNVVHTTDRTACVLDVIDSAHAAVFVGNTATGVGNTVWGIAPQIVCLNTPLPVAGIYSDNLCDRDHPNCFSCQSLSVPAGAAQPACRPTLAPYPDSNGGSVVGQIELKGLGSSTSSLGESDAGWNGEIHNLDQPESIASIVDLKDCVSTTSGGTLTTTCSLFADRAGQIGSVISTPTDPIGAFTYAAAITETVFESDLTGSITYVGGLPVPSGPLTVEHLSFEADQKTNVTLFEGNVSQDAVMVRCSGASLGDSGVCEGPGFDGFAIPCVVTHTTSDGSMSRDCQLANQGSPTGLTLFGLIDAEPITLSTGGGTLGLTSPCTTPPGNCHCPGQAQRNDCPSGVCLASGECSTDSSIACFPDLIEGVGSTSPLVVAGTGCIGSANPGAAGLFGIPGPSLTVQEVEVEGLP